MDTAICHLREAYPHLFRHSDAAIYTKESLHSSPNIVTRKYKKRNYSPKLSLDGIVNKLSNSCVDTFGESEAIEKVKKEPKTLLDTSNDQVGKIEEVPVYYSPNLEEEAMQWEVMYHKISQECEKERKLIEKRSKRLIKKAEKMSAKK